MINERLQENETHMELQETLFQTSSFMQCVEEEISSADDEGTRLMWAEVYQAMVQARAILRKAEQKMEETYAKDIQYLDMNITLVQE